MTMYRLKKDLSHTNTKAGALFWQWREWRFVLFYVRADIAVIGHILSNPELLERA